MKPPSTPSRFQSHHRHYHRHQADDPSSWDNWVGGKRSTGKAVRVWKIIGISAVVLAFLGLVALMIYQG